MIKRFVVLVSVMLVVLALAVSPAAAAAPSCNWGELTSDSIAGGFDQGAHSSDPSGDGNGPETRVGLGNVVEQGNLEATCNLIASLLP